MLRMVKEEEMDWVREASRRYIKSTVKVYPKIKELEAAEHEFFESFLKIKERYENKRIDDQTWEIIENYIEPKRKKYEKLLKDLHFWQSLHLTG